MRVCAAGVSRISTISTHLCQAQAVEVEVWSVVPGKIVHDWVGTNSKNGKRDVSSWADVSFRARQFQTLTR